MNADPLLAYKSEASRTIAAMVNADERLEREFSKLTLPVLILQGTSDNAAKPSGSQRLFDDTNSKDKQLKLYEGHAHDLLNDHSRERVLEDILRWVEGRLPWIT